MDLVPGDIFLPNKEVPCDSILLNGEIYVDESTLTGENVPIAKTPLKLVSKSSEAQHWLYEGSKIETIAENSYCVAVDVGFASKKGQIIRKISNRVSEQPDFMRKLFYFLTEVTIVYVLVCAGFLKVLFSLDIEKVMITFRFL